MEKTKLFYMMEIHSCCQMDIYLCCQTEIFLLPDGNIFILVSRWIAPDWSLRVAISSDHSAWGERVFFWAILVQALKTGEEKNDKILKGLFTYYVSQKQQFVDPLPPSVSNGHLLADPPPPPRQQLSAFG